MGDTSVPGPYLRQVAEQVRASGASVGAWLARCGASDEHLSDPSLVISFPLFERLVLAALELTNEPALGLLVGKRLQASAHGVLGYAALNASTMRQAGDVLARFVPVRMPALSVTHEILGREAWLRFEASTGSRDLERVLLEAAMLSVKNTLDTIAMRPIPLRVTFSFARPTYARLTRELFGCDVRWRQRSSSVVLPSAALDAPLALADPRAFEEATRICERELAKLTETSLAARVKRELLQSQSGLPSLEVSARLFHMTPRTLHRRLQEEGTSFRRLVEEVRRALALEHLKSGRFSVQEIAYRLGYSDQANFRRAFKRWESIAPSRYRARLKARPRA